MKDHMTHLVQHVAEHIGIAQTAWIWEKIQELMGPRNCYCYRRRRYHKRLKILDAENCHTSAHNMCSEKKEYEVESNGDPCPFFVNHDELDSASLH